MKEYSLKEMFTNLRKSYKREKCLYIIIGVLTCGFSDYWDDDKMNEQIEKLGKKIGV